MNTLFAILGVLTLIALFSGMLCWIVNACRHQKTTLLDLGAWVWGALLLSVIVSCLWIIVYAAQYMDAPNQKDNPTTFHGSDMPVWFPNLYHVVGEFSTLIGALVAFGGLAWAHFFTMDRKKDQPKDPIQNVVILDQETKKKLYFTLKNEFDSAPEVKSEPVGASQPTNAPDLNAGGGPKSEPESAVLPQ